MTSAAAVETRRPIAIPHAVLIEGGSPGGRMEKAMELLKSYFADDPLAAEKLEKETFEDLIVLEPEEGKDIGVDMVVDLIALFKQKPFASTGKACLIPEGERMNEHAQNKLLKLLEEPAAGDVILILAENSQRLLPTICSRCMRMWLGYQRPDPGRLTDDIKALTAALIYGKGTFAEAGQVLARYEGSREEAVSFLGSFQLFLRNLSVGRIAAELAWDGTEDGLKLRESAAKVQRKHADRMRRGVALAEKAQRDIERGDRIRYTLRSMALSLQSGI